MIHLCAFTSAPSTTNLTDITPVPDTFFQIEGSRFVAPVDLFLVAAYARSPSLDRAQVAMDRPLVAQDVLTDIRPITLGSNAQSDPALALFLDQPVRIREGAQFGFVAQELTAGQQVYGLLWLTDRIEPAPRGGVITLRGTVTGATPVVNAWSTLDVVWGSKLYRGTYAIIGSEVVSLNAVAHRWLSAGGSQFEPGALSQIAAADRTHPLFYGGQLGQWHTFEVTADGSTGGKPALQVLCSVADTTHTVFLHVVKVK
jgi:hypothetical protein